jgi:hypothetical protein
MRARALLEKQIYGRLVSVCYFRPKWWQFWLRSKVMVTMNVGDNFTYTLAAVPTGSVIDGPPTAPVDNPGIVNITPSADGLTVNVVGAAPGTCTITPTALANGITITGTPIQVTVNAPTPPPPVFATGLAVTVGPVVPAA